MYFEASGIKLSNKPSILTGQWYTYQTPNYTWVCAQHDRVHVHVYVYSTSGRKSVPCSIPYGTGYLCGTALIAKFHGANMGPIWGRQEPDGPHAGPMNFAIWLGWGLPKPRSIFSSLRMFYSASILVSSFESLPCLTGVTISCAAATPVKYERGTQ